MIEGVSRRVNHSKPSPYGVKALALDIDAIADDAVFQSPTRRTRTSPPVKITCCLSARADRSVIRSFLARNGSGKSLMVFVLPLVR